MFPIIVFLVFVALKGASAQTDCVPDQVQNITLDFDYQLSWEPSTNCESVAYIIYIQVEDEVHYIYNILDTVLDVSFLPHCERFYFEVRAYTTQNILSEESHMETYVPAPSGANLTITSFTATVQGDNSTFLSWQVVNEFSHCARAFRVVIGDSYSIIPRDVYTERNFLFLNDLVPCGVYTFGIMAIYDLATEGPISLIDYTAPQQRPELPVLESVNQSDTSISLSWSLAPFTVNSCPLRSMEVEGLPFLHQSYPVDDSPERPLFTTTLSDLQPDNMYMLRVSLINTAGASDIYPIGVQTLPTSNA